MCGRSVFNFSSQLSVYGLIYAHAANTCKEKKIPSMSTVIDNGGQSMFCFQMFWCILSDLILTGAIPKIKPACKAFCLSQAVMTIHKPFLLWFSNESVGQWSVALKSMECWIKCHKPVTRS